MIIFSGFMIHFTANPSLRQVTLSIKDNIRKQQQHKKKSFFLTFVSLLCMLKTL